MSGFMASMFDGLLVGSVYGLAAMGLSLIWGVMNVINLAHGVMIAFGMFGLYFLFNSFTVNAYVLLLPIMAAGFVAGVIIYWDCCAPHGWPAATDEPALHLCGEHDAHRAGTMLWSTSPYNVNFTLPGITVGRYTFTGDHIAAAVVGLRHRRSAGTFSLLHALRQGDSRGERQS